MSTAPVTCRALVADLSLALPQAGGATRASTPRSASAAGEHGALIAAAAQLLAASRITVAAPSPALDSAIGKLQGWSDALGSDSLADGLGLLLLAQGKHTAQRCSLAKGNIEGNFRRMEQENLHQIKLLKERAAEAREAGFFETLGKIFKAIGAALTAVAAAMTTNPALIAGAALLVTSFVASCVGGDVANVIALVSGIAGGAFSIGGAFGGASKILENAGSIATEVCRIGTYCANGVVVLSDIEQAVHKGRMLDADAALLDSRNDEQKLRRDTDDERDVLRELRESTDRGLRLVLKVFTSDDRAATTAVRAGA